MATRPAAGELKPEDVVAVSGTGAVTLPFGYANCLWVGLSGSLTITTKNGDIAFAAIAAGMWHPMPNFTAITNITTATGIVIGRTK